jgi:hypothetical protein
MPEEFEENSTIFSNPDYLGKLKVINQFGFKIRAIVIKQRSAINDRSSLSVLSSALHQRKAKNSNSAANKRLQFFFDNFI